MKLSECIEQAHAIWSAHPTAKSLARDANGYEVNPSSPDAASWCAIGALYKVTGDDYGQVNVGRVMLMRALGCAVSKANDEGWLTSDHWKRAAEYARELEEPEQWWAFIYERSEPTDTTFSLLALRGPYQSHDLALTALGGGGAVTDWKEGVTFCWQPPEPTAPRRAYICRWRSGEPYPSLPDWAS